MYNAGREGERASQTFKGIPHPCEWRAEGWKVGRPERVARWTLRSALYRLASWVHPSMLALLVLQPFAWSFACLLEETALRPCGGLAGRAPFPAPPRPGQPTGPTFGRGAVPSWCAQPCPLALPLGGDAARLAVPCCALLDQGKPPPAPPTRSSGAHFPFQCALRATTDENQRTLEAARCVAPHRGAAHGGWAAQCGAMAGRDLIPWLPRKLHHHTCDKRPTPVE